MMDFINLIADFFNSLELVYKVLIIAGACLLVAFVVVLCCVVGHKRKKKEKRAIEEKREKNKKALDEFTSTPHSQEHEELSVRFNGAKEEEVTSEPKLDEESNVERVECEEEKEQAEEEQVDKIERSDDVDAEFCEEIETTTIEPITYDDNIGSDSVEIDGFESESDDVFAFVKNKENKAPVGFTQKIAEAESNVKANYCDIINYALSYKKIKMRKNVNSEKAYAGSNVLFMLKIHGKSLRVYYALRFADYENTTIPVSDESGKKSYDKTPVMLKITGPLSVKRAKILIDDVAKRYALEKGKEKTVITAEEI